MGGRNAVPSSPGSPNRRNSVERIRRLERLEKERLADQERKDERRRQSIAGAKPSGGRNDVVDAIETVTKYPMALLGLAWLVVGVMVLTREVTRTASVPLVTVLFVLWALVLLEYLVRLVVAPDRRGYLRRRWVEPATVAVPLLQGWHLVGIERVTLLVHEAELRLEVILKHHSLFRVLIAATGTLFVGAWLDLLFEENAKGSNIHTYPEALWWAIVTVTTVGYGDRYPVTGGGRTVAVVLMLVGIGLIGVLTATVASIFVKEHADASKEEIKQSHANLGDQLAAISDRLAELESRLAAPTAPSPPAAPTSPGGSPRPAATGTPAATDEPVATSPAATATPAGPGLAGGGDAHHLGGG